MGNVNGVRYQKTHPVDYLCEVERRKGGATMAESVEMGGSF